MDQWKSEGFCQSTTIQGSDLMPDDFHQHHRRSSSDHARLPFNNQLQNTNSASSESSKRVDLEFRDPVVARKVHKADREKLRRDRLNEQFLELGNALDPERPKNDKATILTDTIQMLKDLTAQVNRLKAEYTLLSEESRELTQEKNELREEKATLKADVDSLNAQYQQRLTVMYPWAAVDPSVVMAPPPFPYPMLFPVPPGPIPLHPSLQPYPFFRNQNPGAVPNPYPPFPGYNPSVGPQVELPSVQYVSLHPQPSSRSHTSSKHESRSKSPDRQQGSNAERSDASNDVATELELKIPGSRCESISDQELSSEDRKGKHCSSQRSAGVADRSCSSKCSSSRGLQDTSSNSIGDQPVVDN